jgi:DNA-binding NtrC family response regulator
VTADRRTDIVAQRLVTRAVQRFRVSAIGGEPAAEATADSAELTIGSEPGNQLVLDDPTVSRAHCVILATPRGFRLRDLGSTNGTWLAGHLVEVAYLKPGTQFRVGPFTLRFDCLDELIQEELSSDDRLGDALGASPAMRHIFATVAKIAPSDSTVLLEGETGTGKGLIADLIHRQSARAAGPFVVVDCASIAPTLIESELFGHEKGAFTGAVDVHAGAFEQANGGTVFLDEIGELPLDLQAKLLRALEERVVKRVGAVQPIRLDVRVLAATNRELREEVNRGRFRADLYYRLDVLRLRLPPLRERREDIALLAQHFYRILTADDDAVVPPALLAHLAEHPWPGNVRELRSAIERAVLAVDSELDPPRTPTALADQVSFREAKERAIATFEREYLSALVADHNGNLSRAARAARMDRAHLRELLRKHGIATRTGS